MRSLTFALGIAIFGTILGACSDSESTGSSNDTTLGEDGGGPGAEGGANVDAASGADGGGGDAGGGDADVDSGPRGVAMWSADVSFTDNDDVRLAATDTQVGVAAGTLTVIGADGTGKTEVPIGDRWLSFVRAIGTKLVVTGMEGLVLATSPGAYTAEVTPTGLVGNVVVPVAKEQLLDTLMLDGQRNIGIAEAIDGVSGETTVLRRIGPTGTELGKETFTEGAQNSIFYLKATAMSDTGAIASAGSLGRKVDVLLPGAAPFSYTMPVAFVTALAFGSDRLAIASRQLQRSVVHVASFGGQLLDSVAFDGLRVNAIVMPNDHEIIVAGDRDGTVNDDQPVVRRYDLTKDAEVWTYAEPEIPNGVTRAVAVAVAPNGAVYVAMHQSVLNNTASKIVRLSP